MKKKGPSRALPEENCLGWLGHRKPFILPVRCSHREDDFALVQELMKGLILLTLNRITKEAISLSLA